MGFLDIILGGFLCFGLYNGLKNGLFVELASLISLVLGIYFAIKFSSSVGLFFQNQFSWNFKFVKIFAFVLTFLLVVIGIRLMAKVFTKIANFAFLGWLNKLGGGGFNVLKTILLLSVVLNIFQKINVNNFFVRQETLNKSIFFNPIQEISGFIFPSLAQWYDDLKEKTKDQ